MILLKHMHTAVSVHLVVVKDVVAHGIRVNSQQQTEIILIPDLKMFTPTLVASN